VLYVSIKERAWEKAFTEPFDRIVIAGGDGAISRLAPWLAGRETPFCILPQGTANNCARSLGQLNTVERVISGLKSERIKKLDLGVVTSSTGHRMFIESIGIGLLAESMSEMRALEKQKKSKIRMAPEERLVDALKYLRRMAKDYPEIECELLLDDEIVAGGGYCSRSPTWRSLVQICSYFRVRIPVTVGLMWCGSKVSSGTNGESTFNSAEEEKRQLRQPIPGAAGGYRFIM
jgi:hypothetical protein